MLNPAKSGITLGNAIGSLLELPRARPKTRVTYYGDLAKPMYRIWPSRKCHDIGSMAWHRTCHPPRHSGVLVMSFELENPYSKSELYDHLPDEHVAMVRAFPRFC